MSSESDSETLDSMESFLEETNPDNLQKLKELLREIDEFAKKELPTCEQILTCSFSMSDKSKLLQYFLIFKYADEGTEEKLIAREKLIYEYQECVARDEKFQSLSKEERNRVEEEIKRMKQPQSFCDLEYKIATMKLEDKDLIIERYKKMCLAGEDEYGKISDWLNLVVQIPFGIYSNQPPKKRLKRDVGKLLHHQEEIQQRLIEMKRFLDKELYGMEQVKEQLLLYVYQRFQFPQSKQNVLGLKGKSGMGKTLIIKLLSQILTIPFTQISCDSLTKDSLQGHSYTYIGSEPGKIVYSLIQMKCMDGILFLDEFDKIPESTNLNGLLHILDPIQQKEFKDQFIGEVPIDLSHLWFILSMNEAPTHEALKDRIFLIELPDYTFKDKVCILKDYVLPKLTKEFNLSIRWKEGVLEEIVRQNPECHMRQLIFILKDVLMKISFLQNVPLLPTSFSTKPVTTIGMDQMMKLLKKNKDSQEWKTIYS